MESVFEETMPQNQPKPEEENRYSGYRKHRGSQTRWNQTDPHQDITIKKAALKTKNSKDSKRETKRNKVVYKRLPIRLSADFSTEILQGKIPTGKANT